MLTEANLNQFGYIKKLIKRVCTMHIMHTQTNNKNLYGPERKLVTNYNN